MLKITKGLKPFVEEGITSYIDDRGNEYVRVKEDDEDFCITLHDYTKDAIEKTGKFKGLFRFRDKFTWDEAMKSMKDEGLTLPAWKQAELYTTYLKEINDKLKEMGGEALLNNYYWTSDEFNDEEAWAFIKDKNRIDPVNKIQELCVRPIINLTDK